MNRSSARRGTIASRARALAAALACTALGSAGCHVLDFSPRHGPGEIAIFDDLFAVSVANEQHAVAVGHHGAIYWTADGGATWGQGETPTERLLYSVSMADSQRGWAVGQLGTILRTEDGGRTWALQSNLKIDEGKHLFGVQAIDSRRAWAVGEWGTKILTEDGGQTWVDHSLGVDSLHPMFVWLSSAEQERVRRGEKVYEDVGLNNISCLRPPSRRCWIVGEFGYIFWSDDMGQTWTRGEIVGEATVEPIQFRHNEIEVGDENGPALREFAAAIADSAYVNVSIDPFASAREVAEFGSTEDPYELFDVLEARMNEVRTQLEDAGVLGDRIRLRNKPPWDYEDFLESDPGFLQRYLDSRTAETPQVRVAVIQNPYLFSVRFKDEDSGLISGLGGVLLKSEDGGLTWRYVETDRKQVFFAVEQADGRAVAVGETGLVRESRDGGETWAEPAASRFPQVFTFMRDLSFDRNRKTGFIVGQHGMILKTEDAGASWDWVLPPPDRRRGV